VLPGVTRFSVGQRVAVATPYKLGNGTWAEYAAFAETDLIAVPNTVSDEDAAQFFVSDCSDINCCIALDSTLAMWPSSSVNALTLSVALAAVHMAYR
jgi:NADPH:quinone reductase-like Zn-dependent oxidoreductase